MREEEMSEAREFNQFSGTQGYIASQPLIDAVNCSIALERPLLIKGEPGTGKTLLALHVAEALGMPMESWHIKSTSKAAEGLYVYDTIQRFNDARFGEGDVKDIRSYIKHGPLGRVFKPRPSARAADRRDRQGRSRVSERHPARARRDALHGDGDGRRGGANHRPVVIITSNNEKELPDAFLRRCVFHFIDFPDRDLMKEIVDVHHPNLDAKLLDQVLIKFYWLRGQTELRKKPSTSELIDWIAALLRSGISLDQVEAHIPFLGSLLKNEQDTEAMQNYAEGGGKLPEQWSDLGPKYNQ